MHGPGGVVMESGASTITLELSVNTSHGHGPGAVVMTSEGWINCHTGTVLIKFIGMDWVV